MIPPVLVGYWCMTTIIELFLQSIEGLCHHTAFPEKKTFHWFYYSALRILGYSRILTTALKLGMVCIFLVFPVE